MFTRGEVAGNIEIQGKENVSQETSNLVFCYNYSWVVSAKQ